MLAVIFDTETTGVLKKDLPPPDVIELAWVELDPNFDRVENISCERFKPAQPIQLGALATHHILESDLTHCQPSSEARIPQADYLVGHNVDFDWEVLGKPPGRRICTLALSRSLWPELDSHTQTAMFYQLHGKNTLSRDVVKNAHSALHDVAMCHQILKAIVEKLGVKTMEELWRTSEDARIPKVMTFGKHKGAKISDVDRGWVKWYRQQPDTDPYLLMAFSRAGK